MLQLSVLPGTRQESIAFTRKMGESYVAFEVLHVYLYMTLHVYAFAGNPDILLAD